MAHHDNGEGAQGHHEQGKLHGGVAHGAEGHGSRRAGESNDQCHTARGRTIDRRLDACRHGARCTHLHVDRQRTGTAPVCPGSQE